MDKKKIIEVIAALFIAAIFISSYISNTNYDVGSNATTTVPATAIGIGFANGIITGYGSPVSISVSCSNSTMDNGTVLNVTNRLTNMENNNSISNFYNSNLKFEVAMGNISSYAMYKNFKTGTNAAQSGCLNFTGPAYVELPLYINFTVGTQEVPIQINSTARNNTVSLPFSKGIGTSLKLKTSALITANGTIYGPLNIVIIH